MSTPFYPFTNTIVRLPLKTREKDSDGFLAELNPDDIEYSDILLYMKKKTSRNPTIPSALDSFDEMKLGVSVYPMEGYFTNPSRIPPGIELNKNYYASYKPQYFDRQSSEQFCQVRFINTPVNAVNADFFTGDFTEIILIIPNRIIDIEEYPSWESVQL